MQEVIANSSSSIRAQLVISHSGQLAASGGIDSDPLAEFLEIDARPIPPNLTVQERKAVMESGKVPPDYGVLITSDEGLHTIKIRYRYLGIPFTKDIHLSN